MKANSEILNPAYTAREGTIRSRIPRLAARALVLAIGALILFPLAYMLLTSILVDPRAITSGFSTASYKSILTGGKYLLGVIWPTIWLSLITTALDIVFAVPIALVITRVRSQNWRFALMVAVLVPLWTNAVVRAFGWYITLGDGGVVSEAFSTLGWQGPRFIGTPLGVVVGMIEATLPFVVFPLINVFESIPKSSEEAAKMVGANDWKVFFKVTWPQIRAGVAAGALLAFGLCASAFAVPSLLGAGRVRMVAVVAYDGLSYGDLGFAGALGTILLGIIGIAIGLSLTVQRFSDLRRGRSR